MSSENVKKPESCVVTGENVMKDPEIPIKSVDKTEGLFGRLGKELEGIVIENNTIKGPVIPSKPVYQTIGEALIDTLSKEPEHVAQIDSVTGKQTTFREMKDKSIHCAMWMKAQGINENDIIVMCTHNHLDIYAPVFATFMVEAIYTAWDHEITENMAKYLINFYKPKIIFANEGAVDVLQRAAELEHHEVKLIVFGSQPQAQSFDEIIRYQSDDEVEKFVVRKEKDPKKLAAIVLTSGSTGKPKGVMYSSKSMVENWFINARIDSVYLSYSTLMWITGFGFLLLCTLTRMTRLLSQRSDPEEICRIIEKYKVNKTLLTPTALARLAKSSSIERYDLQALREIATGGMRCPEMIIKKLKDRIPNANIIQYFGITEVGGQAFNPIPNPSTNDSLGVVVKNVEVKIVDPTSGEALGPNKTGELCIRKPNMMLGYYNNPEATKEALDPEGWLHTGDLCYYAENGELFFVERLKEMMKFQNYHVTPAELEQLLSSHPAVMDVAVVPIPHEIDGEWPMAFVQTVPGKKVTEDELIKLSLELGEKKKLRGGVKFLDTIPKTATGKTARAELKRMAKSYSSSKSK